MAEQPPHTSLLVLNLKILKTGSWKEKTEFSLNKTCLVPDEAINQSYYTHIKTSPENSLKHFLVHDEGKKFTQCLIGCHLEVKEDQLNSLY